MLVGDVANGKALFTAKCTACHEDNMDGTFTGKVIAPTFDVNAFAYPAKAAYAAYSADTAQDLADFILDVMGGYGKCDAPCSQDTAAYLWSLRDL